MGKRGPKPKPTSVRIFEGDPGRLLPKREGEIQPDAPQSVPEPPEWLEEAGKQVWLEVAPHLHAIGCLTNLDCQLLSLYCEAWDELKWAVDAIEEFGRISVSEKGGEYQHPAVGIKNKAIQRIKQIGGEFGMSPSSRVGLNILGGNDTGDELEQFKKSS